MVPFLVEILKFPQHRAHGTSMVAVVFTGMAGAAAYAIHGSVDLRAAGVLALTAIATAHFGALIAGYLPGWKLKRTFGIFIILAAVLLFSKPYLHVLRMDMPGEWSRLTLLLVSGSVAGLIAGMMGVGGGIVMVPVLVLVLGFNQHLAQGTSLLVMVPAAGAGAWTHKRLGNVEARLLFWIVPGLFLGAFTGASVAHLLNEGLLRGVFAIVLTWLGIRFVRARSPQGSMAENP